ncbi:hypothetical protein FFWV33_09510 [Flavobacterium faecale]|uniref:Acyltransferase 3 domain-containing protein n=1 Tax=Flavobacterium faecale TaxID=1355330 RepID=A0A2S1LDK6_9FLAO|nr:acyltransferase [Flavobacterium faecale]AWG21761.1 hypothetical protein FFWV33_09510 [Flavobacterium faecale]
MKSYFSEFKSFLHIDVNTDRIYGLDILRAVAIIFTVLLHGKYLIESEIYKYILYFVFDGVTIFFVLSGFLIGGILIKLLNTNIINKRLLLSFWIRRWLRTVPTYFLVLTIALALNYFFSPDFVLADKIIYYIFCQNIYTPHPSFFGEAWSLSVEEWFYILIPILIFTFLKLFTVSVNNSILLTSLLIITVTTFFRYYRYLNFSSTDLELWNSTFRYQVATRLDSLMYGISGAYIFQNFNYLWYKFKLHFLTIGLLLILSSKINLFPIKEFGIYNSVFSFSFTSIGILFLLPYFSSVKKGKGFIYKIISKISLISYSMYLIHYSIIRVWLLPLIKNLTTELNPYLIIILIYASYWLLTILFANILYKYFEIPTMNLRNKLTIDPQKT